MLFTRVARAKSGSLSAWQIWKSAVNTIVARVLGACDRHGPKFLTRCWLSETSKREKALCPPAAQTLRGEEAYSGNRLGAGVAKALPI